MARASTVTLLSLDRYAKIMGITPAHFNQAAGDGTPTSPIFPLNGSCGTLYYQYAWQDADKTSREDIADAIFSAENDLAQYMGYFPALKWVTDEVVQYPVHYRRNVYDGGVGLKLKAKSVRAHWGAVYAGGQRASTLVGTASTAGLTLSYVDEDGDGYDEIARVILPTTITDIRELHLYFHGYAGAPAWEIRPLKAISVAGGNVTIDVYVWQTIVPELWEAFPTTAGVPGVNLGGAAVFVDELDVYREYHDSTATAARFYWEPDAYANGMVATIFCPVCQGTGCETCGFTTQDGCLHTRDAQRGIVVPAPATYDRVTEQWTAAPWTGCREPDIVKLWYRAGEQDDAFKAGVAHDPLSHYWAQIIAYMATARLERALCACGNVEALSRHLRVDLAVTPDKGDSYVMSDADLANPFGTRRGEIIAWRKLRNYRPRSARVAVV